MAYRKLEVDEKSDYTEVLIFDNALEALDWMKDNPQYTTTGLAPYNGDPNYDGGWASRAGTLVIPLA